jgi:hypothetical protein
VGGQSYPVASKGAVDVHVGETVKGWVELKNTGSETWKPGVVYLAPIPRDKASPFQSPSWASDHRISTVAKPVAPGATGHFELDLTGHTVGESLLSLGWVAEGITWFADAPKGGGPDDGYFAVKVNVLAALPGSGGAGGAGGSGAGGDAGGAAQGGTGGAAGQGSAGSQAGAAGQPPGGAGGQSAGGAGGHAGNGNGQSGMSGAAGQSAAGHAAAGHAGGLAGGPAGAAGAAGGSGELTEVDIAPGDTGSDGGCSVGPGATGATGAAGSRGAWVVVSLALGLIVAGRARRRAR